VHRIAAPCSFLGNVARTPRKFAAKTAKAPGNEILASLLGQSAEAPEQEIVAAKLCLEQQAQAVSPAIRALGFEPTVNFQYDRDALIFGQWLTANSVQAVQPDVFQTCEHGLVVPKRLQPGRARAALRFVPQLSPGRAL
jgi:hypothetical protein